MTSRDLTDLQFANLRTAVARHLIWFDKIDRRLAELGMARSDPLALHARHVLRELRQLDEALCRIERSRQGHDDPRKRGVFSGGTP